MSAGYHIPHYPSHQDLDEILQEDEEGVAIWLDSYEIVAIVKDLKQCRHHIAKLQKELDAAKDRMAALDKFLPSDPEQGMKLK